MLNGSCGERNQSRMRDRIWLCKPECANITMHGNRRNTSRGIIDKCILYRVHLFAAMHVYICSQKRDWGWVGWLNDMVWCSSPAFDLLIQSLWMVYFSEVPCDPSLFAVHRRVFSGCEYRLPFYDYDNGNETACLLEACRRRENAVNVNNNIDRCFFRACEGNDTRLGIWWRQTNISYTFQGEWVLNDKKMYPAKQKITQCSKRHSRLSLTKRKVPVDSVYNFGSNYKQNVNWHFLSHQNRYTVDFCSFNIYEVFAHTVSKEVDICDRFTLWIPFPKVETITLPAATVWTQHPTNGNGSPPIAEWTIRVGRRTKSQIWAMGSATRHWTGTVWCWTRFPSRHGTVCLVHRLSLTELCASIMFSL